MSTVFLVVLLGVIAWALLHQLPFPFCGIREPISKTRSELKMLEAACRSYAAEYGLYPTGNNSEMLQILRGQNRQQIVFVELPARRDALNQQGEFLDPWHTPYRFSLIEGQRPVILSAGKNRARAPLICK